MKLEFLGNLSDGGKFQTVVSDNLIRLYDFGKEEAKQFSEVIRATILMAKRPLDLASVDFIQQINCSLILFISKEDRGIATTDEKNFFCNLTLDSYERMTDLIKPFWINDSDGYQWLYELDNPIDLLFSPGGTW